MGNPMNALAAVVDDEITKSGLTKRDVAERSGIAYSTLRRRLSGDGNFNLRELFAVANTISDNPGDMLARAVGAGAHAMAA